VKATELPAFIIKRLPLRFTFNNNYFNDRYQGIPIGGYNKIITGLLNSIETRAGINFFSDRNELSSLANKIVFTGRIDEFFDYQFGELGYRSLRFEHEVLTMQNFQGNAVMNFCDASIPYTRIIEHKHFEFGTQPVTVITKEYPLIGNKHNEPYYPINNLENTIIYNKYKALQSSYPKVIFGGRLAEYRYYDMHQVIASALNRTKLEFG
jgi:UDP-galactopyranose mutase